MILITKYNKQQWGFLLFIAAINFFKAVVEAMQKPFVHSIGHEQDISLLEWRVLLSAFDVTVLISGLVLGWVLRERHIHVAVKLSPFIIANACIFLAAIDKLSGARFVAFASCLRILEGFGKAMFVISSTKVITCFYREIYYIIPVMEVFNGLGWIFGPFIAQVLYDLIGFAGPFAFVGALMNLIGVLALLLIDFKAMGAALEVPGESYKSMNTTIFKKFLFWVMMFATAICGAAWSYLVVELWQNVLSTENEITMVFMIGSVACVAVTPIWGHMAWISDHVRPSIVATIIALTGYTLIPLASWVMTHGMMMINFSVGVFGIGAAGVSLIPLLYSLEEAGDARLVTGMWLSADAFGTILAANVGAEFVKYMGFEGGSLIIGMLYIVLVSVLIAVHCKTSNKMKQIEIVEVPIPIKEIEEEKPKEKEEEDVKV